MFQKILIANRGEIACRVIKTARRMGIRTGEEVHHRTLLSVVKDQAMVDEMVRLAQEIAGNLDEPNSGFLFVVPVLQAYGLNRKE